MKKILASTFLSFFIFLAATGQKGYVSGTVFDGTSGETLPGVSVLVEGTTVGTITDLDGMFSIPVEPGRYTLVLSFISFETQRITDVDVTEGETTSMGEIEMQEASIELEEVMVTASAVRNTESALMTLKQKSASVIDGISAAALKKVGDSDAASSIRRVSGVSVQGGKYVYIRGLGDRYTKTLLNGLEIPGLDPDRNTIQMDIFPNSIIDNLLVYKSFSADLPASFTGGLVNIITKEFPETAYTRVGASYAVNPSMHFRNDFLNYEGGKTDFLGFDDGTRAIPATEDIPFFSEVVGNPDSEKGQRYRQILEGFNPVMAAQRGKNQGDFSVDFTSGKQWKGANRTWAYQFVFNYKKESRFYKNTEFGRYGLPGNVDETEMEEREYQKGDLGEEEVFLSGMAGVAMKTLHSKYSLTLLHLQSGISKAGIFDYRNNDQGAVFNALQHNLDYTQRGLTTLILDGKHSFADNRWELTWKAAPSYARSEDPDVRFTRYEIRSDGLHISTEAGFPERIWRDLKEINLAGAIDLKHDFTIRGSKSTLKTGVSGVFKERDFIIRSFAFNIRNIPLTGNPDELFYEENLWPYQDNPARGTTYEARFVPNNPNQFSASSVNPGIYLSDELFLTRKIKLIAGIRVEAFRQRYTGTDQLGGNVMENDLVLDEWNLFPSLNLVWQTAGKQNLRFSYNKTIARPSFKELSYAEIYDPVTGRTFVGGLFRDADDIAGIEYWDGNLVSTTIHNFDLRWEWFGERSQMLSLSLFYKKFIRPIEIVQYATQTGAFQPRNVGDGTVAGFEAEFIYDAGRIAPAFRNFSIRGNGTVTRSQVELNITEYRSRIENGRTGETIDKYRDMAGQAPWIINGGLSYDGGEKGFLKQFETGLYYNVQGPTLLFAGIVDRPDIYSEPFHSLKLNATKSFGHEGRWSTGLSVENILNQTKTSYFRSFQATDRYFERISPGTRIKIKLSYKIR